jgi:cytochrome c oxidase subunit 2
MTRFSPSSRRALRLGAVVLGLVFLAACAGDAELDTRSDLAGPEAQDIESFLSWVLWIAYAVFFAVLGVTLYAWKNFRVKGEYEDGDWPEQIHGNNTLEYAWTAAPAVLLAVIGVFTIGLHNSLNSADANPVSLVVGGESIDWEPEIVVVGQQWWWEYQYHFGDVELTAQRIETLPTADLTTATQMVIPVGQEIELEITSRDVIHSHWIPSLNGKRDAVPGRQSAPWKIQADEAGVYFGQCTEFCGLSHSRMRMQVIALSEADFQEWVTAQMEGVALDGADADYVASLVAGDILTPENSTQRAIDTFRTKCSSCHLMDGIADDLWSADRVAEQLVSGAAPNLTHFATRTTFAGGIVNLYDPETLEFNSNELREWLANPEDVKANYALPVSDDDSRMRGMPNLELSTQEIDDLVALLESTGRPSDFIIVESGVE